MKKYILLTLLYLILNESFAQNNQQAIQILNAVNKKYENIEAYSIDVKASIKTNDDQYEQIIRVKAKGDKFTMEIAEVLEVICDGASTWTHYIDNYQIIRVC